MAQPQKKTPTFEAVPDIAAPVAPDAIAAISRNWMSAASECQQELARFVGDRLSKNQAFIAGAAAAPDMQELLRLQVGWMTQTVEDYTHEFGRLSDIVKNGADEAIAVTA